MSYESWRYKQGLSGDKPGMIVLDPEGHRAQTEGYEQYLANRDLADRIAQANQTNESGGWDGYDSSSSPTQPASTGQRIAWFIISLPLLWCAFQLSRWLANHGHASSPDLFDWAGFFVWLLIFPGGPLLWTGLVLLYLALSKNS
jgi:hypothetical protein